MPAPGVRVEIVGGSNAGKVAFTDANGLYRFDDLVTSSWFEIEVSAVGHQTRRQSTIDLWINTQQDFVLTKGPEAGE